MKRLRVVALVAVACSALAAGFVAPRLRARPSPPRVAAMDRKSLVVGGAEVRHTPGGPVARLRVEISYGSSFKAEDVDEIALARIEIADVNPMADHVHGPLTEPAGWSPDDMQIVERVKGPASPQQIVEDRTAVVGATYVYQARYVVSPFREERSPLVAVRVHDPETWWPTARVHDEIASLAAERPAAVRTEVIGRGAHRGLPIEAVSIGSRAEDAPVLAVVGAIHAGESGPELIVPALRKLLARAERDPELARALDRVAVFAVPVVNVDERDRLLSGHPTYLRKSAQGIDLNRNFPAGWSEISTAYGTSNDEPESWTYRGPSPLYALEAAALHDALAKRKVAALFSYHWLYSLSGTQLEQPRTREAGSDALKRRQKELAAAWFEGLSQRPFPAPVKTSTPDASPGGSLVTWVFEQAHAPAFEVEASGEPRLEALRRAPPDRALLAEYQDRHADALRAVLLRLSAGD